MGQGCSVWLYNLQNGFLCDRYQQVLPTQVPLVNIDTD